MPREPSLTAGVTLWVALWWVFEPVPIPVTSLIPFTLFPLCGVLTNVEVATAYGHWLILLLLGGFVLSKAMERSGVHRRLALGMVHAVGGHQPRRLLLGFMLATAVCSWWISNTATTLMLLPVALAVLQNHRSEFKETLLLGIAFGASIGGIATPIGTPPNVVLMGVYQEMTGNQLGFLQWMTFGVPISMTLLAIAWLYLARSIGPQSHAMEPLPQVGPLSTEERRVLAVFALTALAWMTRTQPFGGWTGVLGVTGVGDDTVALAAVIVLFVVPSGRRPGDRLLDWESASTIPWGLLILFGGGIAIARAFMASGLSRMIGDSLATVTQWPLVLLIGTLCLVVTFMTELTSNTATTTLLMPILGASALAAAMEPLTIMVPAAISASCAFMLPVATAPNAIVFGTGQIPVHRMVRRGVVLNLVGVVIITLMTLALVG
jgi:sodium-dependent dicarboxylate transporter 2/3/5